MQRQWTALDSKKMRPKSAFGVAPSNLGGLGGDYGESSPIIYQSAIKQESEE